MIGSLGPPLWSSLALELARPTQRVVVLDGDGNVLMGMCVLSSVGASQPENLFPVVLDNEAHASSCGQKTITDQVALERNARASGYRSADRVDPQAFAG